MAIVTAHVEIQMPSLENWEGEVVAATASQIVISDGYRTETYQGSFSYTIHDEVFGTLNSLSEVWGGVTQYTISNMTADANAVYRAVEIEDDLLKAAQIMLSGNDSVVGSSAGSDYLLAFDGNDALIGNGGNDTLDGGSGNDSLTGGSGNDRLVGGSGTDTAVFADSFTTVTTTETASGFQIQSSEGTDTAEGIEFFQFADQLIAAADLVPPPADPDVTRIGTELDDLLVGGSGNDRLVGAGGRDTLQGGDGTDTLNGGDGDDLIAGGASSDDRRDVIYAGTGNDSVDAGYGNDLVYGQEGNDTIAGGFGADDLQGQDGNDVITGSAFADMVYGGAGNDFVNGGFGHDLINGGTGADRFYHLGIFDHGSDWVQDYSSAEGDVLVFGNASATRSQFQVNFTHTATPEGERSGDDNVEEAFVIYRPTGQIMWALVDGGGQDSINLQIGSEVFDLLA